MTQICRGGVLYNQLYCDSKYTKDQPHINFDFWFFFKAKFLLFKYNDAEIRGETQYLQLCTRDVLSVKKNNMEE